MPITRQTWISSPHPLFDLYDADWPIRTYQPQHPPAKLVFSDEGGGARRRGEALDSIVSGGCVIGGGRLIRSGALPRSESRAMFGVEDSVLLEGVSGKKRGSGTPSSTSSSPSPPGRPLGMTARKTRGGSP